MRDDDLHRRLEGLRADIPSESLPGAHVAREHGEHVRRTRRAGGTALAVLGVVSAVVVTAAGGGTGLATRTPGGATSSPSGVATSDADQAQRDAEQVVSDRLRAAASSPDFDLAVLPARLGPWRPITAAHAMPGGAISCSLALAGESFDGVGASGSGIAFVNGPQGGTAAATFMFWQSDRGNPATLMQDFFTQLESCSGHGVTFTGVSGATWVQWVSGATTSHVVFVSRGARVGAFVLEMAGSSAALSEADVAAIASHFAVHTAAPREDASLAARTRELDDLNTMLVPLTLPGRDPAHDGEVFDGGNAPCLPDLFAMRRSADPRAAAATAGDVLGTAKTGSSWADGSGRVQQAAVEMLTPAAAEVLADQWRRYLADCLPRSYDGATARVTGHRTVPSGEAIDIAVTPKAGTGPVVSPTPGPTGTRMRTIYLGKAGSIVTWICVEGVENHPELRPAILQRALDRLRSQS